MQCFRCKSVRLIKFIDGFGQRRLFCRNCWNSFLENSISFENQKRLLDFKTFRDELKMG
ncbi:MAG: hypothetical protein QXQ18_01330 [Candidatus Aenigmatarchaeota archaeon]